MVDIPKIDEMLAWYHDPKFFTSLDLRSGYYHIKFSPEMRHNSAFTTIIGKSEFLRMPFGFAQGAAYFTILMQCLVNSMIFVSFKWMMFWYMTLVRMTT